MDEWQQCLAAYDAGERVDRATERAAVKHTLALLKEKAPGRSVEVRIPPFAAVQVVEGSVHRRGTPAAVVEMDATTWLRLAAGIGEWDVLVATGVISASGERSDLRPWLPLSDDESRRL